MLHWSKSTSRVSQASSYLSHLPLQLSTLESFGLIRLASIEPDLEYLFRHALVQDAAYDSLLRQDRRKLHLIVARIIERTYPERCAELAASLAYHYDAAGDQPKALHYFTVAADRAFERYAHPEAEGHYRAAIERISEPRERARLVEALGQTVALQSRTEEATIILRQALALAMALGDLDHAASIYAFLSWIQWQGGQPAIAVEMCEEGLAALRNAPDSAGLAALLQETSRVYILTGRLDDAHDLSARALHMAEIFDEVKVQVQALNTLGVAHANHGEMQSAIYLLERACTLSDEHHLLDAGSRAHNNLGWILGDVLARFEEAKQHFQRGVEIAHKQGFAIGEMFNMSNVLNQSLFLGELEHVRRSMPVLMEVLRRVPDASQGSHLRQLVESKLAYYTGDLQAARAGLEPLFRAAVDTGDMQFVGDAGVWLAEVLIEPGAWAEARQCVNEILAFPHYDAFVILPMCLGSTADAHLGNLAEARAALDSARTRIEAMPDVWAAPWLVLSEARLAAVEQQWPQALTAYEFTSRAFAERDMRWYAARVQYEHAEVLLTTGDHPAALDLLNTARAAFTMMGAVGFVTLIDNRLATM
jgi:tetratricopeptide (TPR) repeat protein